MTECCDILQKTLKRKRLHLLKHSLISILNDPNISVRNISLNFAAECYYYHIMGNWISCITAPPPMISSISDGELTDAFELGVPMMTLPCQLQAMKRLVKDISMISVKVFVHKSPHEMLVSSELSQKKKPEFHKKYLLWSHLCQWTTIWPILWLQH